MPEPAPATSPLVALADDAPRLGPGVMAASFRSGRDLFVG